MTHELWHADIDVNDSIVSQCLDRQFPKLKPISLKCIDEGWDNKIYLVNDKLIFRFPRREIAVQLLERENVVLNYLYDKVNISIPNPTYIGEPSDIYPYPFHGYPFIEGVSGSHAELSDENRIASIPALASFLKTLHSIGEEEAIALGAKPQVFDRTKVGNIAQQFNERIEKLISRGIATFDLSQVDAELRKAFAVKLPIDNKVLVHGDLYCRHLLFNQNELTGIIDWGDVGINSPACDLMVVFSFYPEHCHDEFFALYGEVESNTRQYARFLGLYSAISVMVYGHDIGDQVLVNESLGAIKRINSMLLI